jgi:phenylacetic acid degradation operon negative regulatory protein
MQARRPTARSLTLDMLSSLRGASMPVSALVATGDLFGIGDNSVRVTVARLLAAGQIERDERGRYRLGALADPVDRQVRDWSRLNQRMGGWDGGWIGVHYTASRQARGRTGKLHTRALRFMGFATLRTGVAVRPDNLRIGIEGSRAELTELGLAAGSLVFGLRGLDAISDQRARALWDVSGLRAGYRESLARLEQSTARLGGLDEGEAMVESFLLGGRVLRQLALDPLLPETILPSNERAALVGAMRRYDNAGRRSWSAFMARHGAPHFSAPADTRPGESWSLH